LAVYIFQKELISSIDVSLRITCYNYKDMNPEIPLQNMNPEQSSAPEERDIVDRSVEARPETGIEFGAERYEQKSENSAIAADVGLTTILPTPVIDDNNVDDVTTKDNMPAVAKDDDLIEKEWVNKAKEIVNETRDDPYKRDQEVNKLQVDYLKKRYGKELGITE
jgi:hypothetical protein